MVPMKRLVTLVIVTVLTTSAVRGESQQRRRSRDPMPRAGVCFFEDTNFEGEYFCVRAGEALTQMPPGMNDQISSIQVIGNVEVTVFRDVRFEGPSARFFADVSDLRRENWNDEMSSLRVTNASSARERGRGPTSGPVWGRETAPREGACFYQDVNFRGDYFCVPRGASYARVPPGLNDQISSIRLIRASGVIIFRDFDFDGGSARVTADVADLRRGGLNDRISSIRVY